MRGRGARGLGGYEELRPARRGERGSDSMLRSVLRLDGGTAGVAALGTAPLVGEEGKAPSPAPVAVAVVEAGLVVFGFADEMVRVAGAGVVVGAASAAPSASWWVVCCCAARTSARRPSNQGASSAKRH